MKNKLPSHKSRSLGNIGEDLVCQYLLSKNFRIIDRNVYLFHGEIDIIAVKGDILVFIEVKTRTNDVYGDPIEAVTPRKLHIVARTAQLYVQRHPELPEQLRIDVVSVVLDTDLHLVSLRHDESVTE